MFKLQKGSRSVYEMVIIKSGQVFADSYHAGIYMKQYGIQEELCRVRVKFGASPANKRANIKETWQNVQFINLYGTPYPNSMDEKKEACQDLIKDPACDLYHESAQQFFSEILEDCLCDNGVQDYSNLISACVEISQKRASYKNQATKMARVEAANAKQAKREQKVEERKQRKEQEQQEKEKKKLEKIQKHRSKLVQKLNRILVWEENHQDKLPKSGFAMRRHREYMIKKYINIMNEQLYPKIIEYNQILVKAGLLPAWD